MKKYYVLKEVVCDDVMLEEVEDNLFLYMLLKGWV